MSKRPHSPQAPAKASGDLVKRLKAAANDVELLQEIIATNDSSSVAAAFSAMLTVDSSSSPSVSKLRKKAHSRPCRSLPAETFHEVVLFANRDTLDAMQLVCSLLLNFVEEREMTQLALRAISNVNIGRVFGYLDDFDGWLPVIELVYTHDTSRELAPKTIHQLATCLRMAFCESVSLDLSEWPSGYEDSDTLIDLCGMVFDDLVAPHTFVDTLTIRMNWCNTAMALRAIEAFGDVSNVDVESVYIGPDDQRELLGEIFFASAAQHGVWRIEFTAEDDSETPADTAAALSFGFEEPSAGGDRGLRGVACNIGSDFLEQVKQKVAELNETRDVDFTFKLANISAVIDSLGFEKYQRDDGRTWLLNDLENHLNVEVKQTEKLVEIHVFSSA